MIQRIQSLFLLVGTVCLALACFMPVAFVSTADSYYIVTPWAAKLNIPNGEIIHPTYFIGLLQALLAGLSLVTLFLYKKRPLQSRLCLAGMFITVLLLLLMLWVYPDSVLLKLPQLFGGELKFSPWTLLSVIPFGCFYFANKFIVKDEKMVRASDRLR
ncbi:MAG: DUF4293 domain-containing protein [Bacteroidales bacterium]|jgi:hypothetical protein|nr:DUF4293 domain-containing protein [Bacteroidales bacterium]